jgi:hypothetical protein
MENEFIPYEQALALKELGFDEKCLGYFTKNSLELREPYPLCGKTYSAILYQQAFRWFREKYGLEGQIKSWKVLDTIVWYISTESIGQPSRFKCYEVSVTTPEEAELECLKKLIEITKNK